MTSRWILLFVLGLWLLMAVAGAAGAFDPRPGPTALPTPTCLPIQKDGAPPCARPLPLQE